jgi:hypothetical protein
MRRYDKAHEGQVLDHDSFLFRREKISLPWGEHFLQMDRPTVCTPGCQLSATPYENPSDLVRSYA